MSQQFFHGAPLLLGDSTVPGVEIPDELNKLLPRIFKEVSDFGCEYFPTVVQMLTYDEISEIAAYDGFPVRYPHWKWGMEYEELQKGYMYGMHRIYEMVINTNPCYIYCLDSNTLVDNVTVVAHALFHNDFFKNNIFFAPTSQNMMNQLANHGTRIRRYMKRWGKEKVTAFIDNVLRIETLIDPALAWEKREVSDPIITDKRTYRHPRRLGVDEGHEYMEPYINPQKWINKQQSQINKAETAREIGLFKNPTKDIFGFIKDNAQLKPWEQDIMAMLWEESMYFSPQRMTKMLNEGWASYGDYQMMAVKGLVGLGQKTEDSGIIEYAMHKMGVLGGKYSMNPYKLGYSLFMDIEDRWNKGKFGQEWEDCDDIQKKESWDLKLGLGHEKVFEVRKNYNDLTALIEFFTEDFCNKNEFFEWQRFPNGEYKIVNKDYKSIKRKLVQRQLNGGLPEIFLTDPNYKGRNYMLLEHNYEGRTLLDGYVKASLTSLYRLWGREVFLVSADQNGEEIVYSATGPSEEDIKVSTREQHEKDVS